MEVLIGIVVVTGIFAAIWFHYYLKEKRRQSLRAFVGRFGFHYSESDPFGLLEYGFQLLRRGDDRGCENVVWGRWKDLDFKAADYWYYEESTDSEGNTSRDYSHFSIVMVDVECFLPNLSIARENLLTRFADHLGFHDIDFEYEEFNRAFQVKAENRKFAYELIDPRVMEWLLSIDHRLAFEVHAGAFLVYARRMKPEELLTLIGTAKEFRDRIPRLVWTEYGTGSPQRERRSG